MPHSEARPGTARIERLFDPDHNVLICRGQFAPIFDAYLEHARRWQISPDPLVEVMMKQALASSALHLACRPRDEVAAWTLAVESPAVTIFFTGDAGESSVTGRVLTDGVKKAQKSTLTVQSQRPGEELVHSSLEVNGLDVCLIFEQYYESSVQHPARFFDYDDGSFLMVLGLPHVSPEWVAALDRDRALDTLAHPHRVLDDRLFAFACGCSAQRVGEVVHSIYGQDPDSLFLGDEGVEVQCPRCGHAWWLRRDEWPEEE